MRQVRELIEEYSDYKPILSARHDFHSFWSHALQELDRIELNEKAEIIDYPIKQIQCEKVTYRGAYGTPIKGVFLKPKRREQNLKCLIFFHGYNSSKGSISQYMQWLIQDYAVLAVDCRGMGETGDDSCYGSGTLGSWATQGLLDKKEYYYYKVYLDCKRAIDYCLTRPEINPHKICLIGSSLGGGIALAVAALDSRPQLVVADVPNMCDLELAIQLKTEGSLVFIENYLARYPQYTEKVFENLSYFDNVNFASNMKSQVRLSVALKDAVCPPKTIFGVYNLIPSEKTIEIYPFSTHNAPGSQEHIDKTLHYINTNL
ncbi:acetylxylan esterase [Fictibacillus terranigra]|uniref:Alpha/beta fold hydrolase n=1 Tax=Fictibacillus terranigra TaxID=3058424 RepID=A0ABT8E932_9BACL|nr:alpha/beta fold hydrolase [Fictibacillus sp. CENA-BCM004]MDN4074415.1 alpha/beta fold hydrolase [Fictibacillus sp. CENA-BCM004]